jgi:hypothetical protein
MLKGIVVAVTVLAIAACGSKSPTGAKSGDDADSPGSSSSSGESKAAGELAAGTSVCVSELVGVRYHLEDALTEHGLEPVADCMFADVQLEEGGEAGAYFLRFQRTGESEWKRCDSTEEDRIAFLRQCTAEISASTGGGDD